ncbi:thioredoxin domain-containing protein [Sulfurovum sp. zt1-1]|uniref:Thioredoxin domain-containing protein n=1 Tax=Sulfurovum zhangzhouensis TaxID=3019067 RepID=A0ABT7QYZ4_9BACT|nr:thioredoxin domain-containing protein [Sulfurovum zhangzhouensis]MDM5272008.1 thioredoxin domain-containing protein [Sulfurovum zhangzhouensis]
MSLMSKLLTSTLITTLTLSAGNTVDEKELLNYVKKHVVLNPQVEVKGVTIIEETSHPDIPGWNVYLTTMDLNYQGKEIKAPETIFVKDGLATRNLVSLKNGRDYRDEIKPTVSDKFYDDAHLIFGNKNAAHKVLVFSDPQCPFCQEVVPDIMKAAKEHPDQIALYYYHLPLLRIHPVSDVLTRVMHLAQHEGKMDVLPKIYAMKIDPRETDMKKILAEVEKQTGYSVTAEKVDDQKVKDAMKADSDAASEMMVSGTPTIYADGKWDKMRNKYKEFIK